MKIHSLLCEQPSNMVNIAAIKRDCSPFLKLIKDNNKHLLYRGMPVQHNFELFHTKSIRTPTGIPILLHNILGDIMVEEVGYNYREKNALFVSSSLKEAVAYGTSYAVFPIGDFEYTFNKKCGDMFVELNSSYSWTHIKDPDLIDHKKEIVAALEYIFVFKLKSYDSVIRRDSEIDKLIQKYCKYLLTTIFPIIHNRDLGLAIEENDEIIITTDSFYGINCEMLKNSSVVDDIFG